MGQEHEHEVTVDWTGNRGTGTGDGNDQSHKVSKAKHQDILRSVPAEYGGDDRRYNPEELLLASLATCHMIVYLYLCAQEGVRVVGYTDTALLKLTFNTPNKADVTEAVLRPRVLVSDADMISTANALHGRANAVCLVANACRFPVRHEPTADVTRFVSEGASGVPSADCRWGYAPSVLSCRCRRKEESWVTTASIRFASRCPRALSSI